MKILLMLPYPFSNPFACTDLGLGILASCLRSDGHKVTLCIDPKRFPNERTLRDFIRNEQFDVAGIKVMSNSIVSAINTTNIIKESYPQTKIIIGGPHPSGDPNTIFELMPLADYAFWGEAEIGLVDFLRKLSAGRSSSEDLCAVPNLIWRKDATTVLNPKKIIEDLDSIPLPAWDLMDPRNMGRTPFNGYSRRFPIGMISMTRGCPSRCTYCAAGNLALRARSAQNVLDEILLLQKEYGVKEIHFIDSNCGHRSGPLRELCRRIIELKLDITWSAPNGIRLDSIDEELASLMHRSGCFQVNVGIESGSVRILRKIKKGITLDLARQKVGMLRNAGIEVVGFFMMGFPGETADEIRATISFSRELSLTGATFSILCPMPGTEIYEEVYKGRRLGVAELNSFDLITYKNNLSEVSYDALRRFQRSALLGFYLRPKVIPFFLKNLNDPHKILFLLQRAYQYIFK